MVDSEIRLSHPEEAFFSKPFSLFFAHLFDQDTRIQMPEGSTRWSSGGTRRKSKGVEDLYTSRAREAPQKKLWVKHATRLVGSCFFVLAHLPGPIVYIYIFSMFFPAVP